MITNKDVTRELVELEKTDIINAFYSNGLNYWPAIRIWLAFNIIQQRNQNDGHKVQRVRQGLVGLWKGVTSFFVRQRKSDTLFVTHDNYLITVGKNIYDRVLEGNQRDCVNANKTYSTYNLKTGDISFSGVRQTTSSISGRLFILKVYSYVKSRMRIGQDDLDVHVRHIEDRLASAFPGVKISSQALRQFLQYLELLTKYFIDLLLKLGVSSVYQANYYVVDGLAINSAASQLGITSYGVQHGGQSRENPPYGQWMNVPTDGYAMLPDVFLCWDQRSASTIEEWASSNKLHSAQIQGYTWADLWVNGGIKYPGFPKIMELGSETLNVMYTMQPSIGKPPSLVTEMVERFPDGITWWFRLHPRQRGTNVESTLRQMYSGSRNVIISEATGEPLPALLSKMDLHLTCFSSCIYEAMSLNVPTIFIHPMGRDYFDEMIQVGMAELCLTSDSLAENIEKRLRTKDFKTDSAVRSRRL